MVIPVPHLRYKACFGAPGSDLSVSPVPHYTDELLTEVISADAIVLAVPMYNFGVPSLIAT
ncbi:NAD(P)H-dependent oxidoreductase [Microbulbifer agarilyticus]|nr:NAD(P)H-dependent oxidoreductase [Microbulbifer agarilyticus]